MFRHVSTALAMLLVLTSLSACVPSQRQLAMERDLAEMKRRLAAVEKRTVGMGDEFTTGIEDTLADLGRQQAETRAGLDSQRVDMQSLRGRMEDLVMANRQFQEEMSLVREDLSVKVTAIEDRLGALENSTANPTGGDSRQQTEPGSQTADPDKLYEQGLALVRGGDQFVEARQLLQKFIDTYPGNPLAVNAAYWIGEAYYGEKKYENAILQFQDIIQKHPDNSKVPDALLKQGLAFQALGDTRNARVILQKVVNDYPKSNAAGKAGKLLANMQ